MKDLGYNVKTVSPTVLCTLFEENIGELILAQDPATRLETKHIIENYHNFHTYFSNSKIYIIPNDSYKQPEYMLTHLLNKYIFIRHIIFIIEW